MNTIVYPIEDKLYINLTNRCSNSCDFCIRNHHDGIEQYYLWLSSEPSADEVIDELNKADFTKYKQVVFCGFGEPIYRIDAICEIGKYVKSKNIEVRLNTNGQGKLIIGDDIVSRLVPAVDIVSISLNSSTLSGYQEICHSIYGDKSFDSILSFAKECVTAGLKVVMSVMETIGMYDIAECEHITKEIGAKLIVRKLI